jgi:hypothetical protein
MSDPASTYLKYETIQAFKRSGAAVMDGVNYAYVVAPYLYDASWASLFRRLVFSLLFSTRITQFAPAGRQMMVFYSGRHKKRADYDFIASELRRIVGNDGDYAESLERFNPLQWLATLAQTPSALRSLSGYRAGLLDRLSAALLIAKYRSSRRRLESLLSGRRRLVTFCDAHPIENLLAQMAKRREIFSVTAQHGQYRLLNESNMSPDAEAYANFVSDRMLCWGEATCAEFVQGGFARERFVVTGWIKAWSPHAPPQSASAPPGVFGVMLNGDNGKESNLALISAAKSIAREMSMSYLVRLHPQTSLDEIKPFLNDACVKADRIGLDDYLNQVEFSLGHMSGAVIEILYKGLNIYVLDDGKLAEAFRVDGLSYSSVDSMVSAIRADYKYPVAASERINNLSLWYNDDVNQNHRLTEALLDRGAYIA